MRNITPVEGHSFCNRERILPRYLFIIESSVLVSMYLLH